MNRAYSVIEFKAVDSEKRILEGIASTPATDRMEDIVEPLGAEFSLPLPFLWQHDSRQPIGKVTMAKPTKDGIPVRVQLARIDKPGKLKDRVDEAWDTIEAGLVRGLSIGFRAKETADIEGTWGQRFIKWEWLELSAVTIPANAEATITAIKQFDEHARAATGKRAPVRLSTPGASGSNGKTRTSENTMTIAERIGAMEAKLASHLERMNEIENAAAERGETLNEAEQEEFDTLHQEREDVKKALTRARLLEKENATKAKVVDQKTDTKAASESRSTTIYVEREEKLEPGIEAARYAMCLAAAKGDVGAAIGLMQTHYPKFHAGLAVLRAAQSRGLGSGVYIEKMIHAKEAVPAGTTDETTWAAPLVQYQNFTQGFIEYLRPQTIIGRLNIDPVPFKVRIPRQTSGGTGYWVGEGKPKPVTKFDFDSITFDFFKLAAISVITEELLRFSDPSAERLVRNGLAGAVIQKMDGDFIDPAVTASAGVSPASITNGATNSASSGDDADAVRADILTLWGPALAAELALTSALYITTPSIALALSLMFNAFGQQEFPGMQGPNGGTLNGTPVITSNHVPAGTFVLLFQDEILLADDGIVSIDASREASLQMLDNPTNDSDTPTPTTVVSMWQTNSIALRAERFINWARRRSAAVTYLTSVGWGGAIES